VQAKDIPEQVCHLSSQLLGLQDTKHQMPSNWWISPCHS
jgi:hypothetical protein